MKKITALLLAVLMLISLSMYGCQSDKSEGTTEETTAETAKETEVNYDDIPILTAEEYIKAAFQADIENAETVKESFGKMHVNFSMNDIEALQNALKNALPEDEAEVTDSSISVKSLFVDVFMDSETEECAVIINSNINDVDAEFEVYDGADKTVFKTNLLKDAYDMTAPEEEDESVVNAGFSELLKVFEGENAEKLCEVIINNCEASVTDNKKTVTVGMTFSSEQFAEFGVAIYDALKDDETFVAFVEQNLLKSELTDMYYDDFLAEAKNSIDDIKAQYADRGMSMEFDLTLDKLTNEATAADMLVLCEGYEYTLNVEATIDGDKSNLVMKADLPNLHTLLGDFAAMYAMPKRIVLDAKVDVDGEDVDGSIKYEIDKTKVNVGFKSGDGKFEISADTSMPAAIAATLEKTEDEIILEEHSFTLSGTFKRDDSSFEIVPTNLLYDDIEISLVKVGISFSGEYDSEVPSAPETTVKMADLGQYGSLMMISQIATALDIDLFGGGAATTTNSAQSGEVITDN